MDYSINKSISVLTAMMLMADEVNMRNALVMEAKHKFFSPGQQMKEKHSFFCSRLRSGHIDLLGFL